MRSSHRIVCVLRSNMSVFSEQGRESAIQRCSSEGRVHPRTVVLTRYTFGMSTRQPGQPKRGPLPNPDKSARVQCRRDGCTEIVKITGARLAAYRERGVIPWHNRECQRLDDVAWLEGLCACGCGQTWRKPRYEVRKITTGRTFLNAEHALTTGTKPRKGVEVECEGCHLPMYVEPQQVGKKRTHDLDCRRLAQAAQEIEKTCPTCGTIFKVPPSLADKVYDTAHCRRIGIMTNAIPGTEHNGLPKRWDSDGYVLVYEPDHPASGKYGWVYEHRLVVEKREGRYLTPREEVDHKNEVKDDNHPDNLVIMTKRGHASKTGRSVQDRRRAAVAELEQLREEKRLREAGYRPVGEVIDEALRILAEHGTTDEQRRALAALAARLPQEVEG